MKPYRAILFDGRPFSGKSTQAKRLLIYGRYFYVSTGAMIRSVLADENQKGTDLYALCEYVMEGNFLNDGDTFALLDSNIEKVILDGTFDPSKHTVLLDGVPRNEAQVPMANVRFNIEKVIYFPVEDPYLLLPRLKGNRGRSDDTIEKFWKRQRDYDKMTAHVLKHYSHLPRLSIDPMQSEEGIHKIVVDDIIPKFRLTQGKDLYSQL